MFAPSTVSLAVLEHQMKKCFETNALVNIFIYIYIYIYISIYIISIYNIYIYIYMIIYMMFLSQNNIVSYRDMFCRSQ